MIYIISLLMIISYGLVFRSYPEYAVAWALLNTVSYIGLINEVSYKTLEDCAAAVIGWFFAPIAMVFSA